MQTKIIFLKGLQPHFIVALISLLYSISIANAQAQIEKAIAKQSGFSGETAICEIKVTPKEQKEMGAGKPQATRMGKKKKETQSYQLKPNRYGLFARVSDIPPSEKVPVQITYLAGNEGDKVAISVLDGGLLDNGKRVKVAQLDNQKKVGFELEVTTSTGIYRVMLKKENDVKIVQLWVGAEPASARK